MAKKIELKPSKDEIDNKLKEFTKLENEKIKVEEQLKQDEYNIQTVEVQKMIDIGRFFDDAISYGKELKSLLSFQEKILKQNVVDYKKTSLWKKFWNIILFRGLWREDKGITVDFTNMKILDAKTIQTMLSKIVENNKRLTKTGLSLPPITDLTKSTDRLWKQHEKLSKESVIKRLFKNSIGRSSGFHSKGEIFNKLSLLFRKFFH